MTRRYMVDLDGTTLDFVRGWGALYNHLQERYGFREGRPINIERIAETLRYGDQPLADAAGFRTGQEFWEWFDANGGWDWCEPYPGAVEGIKTLALSGEVVFVTARPHTSIGRTQRSLRRHFPKTGFGLVYTSPADKVKLATAGDVWFEDHPDTLAKLVEKCYNTGQGFAVFKHPQPWNTDAPGYRFQWADVNHENGWDRR